MPELQPSDTERLERLETELQILKNVVASYTIAEKSQDTVIINNEVVLLRERLVVVEESDRLQAKALKLTRRIQLGCMFAVAISFVLGFNALQSEENRAAAERLAIALLTAGSAGLLGAEFVDKVKQ